MSNMPVFENPCGAYSRYEITKDIPLARLEELCQAERENRCVVLPCMVGGTAWIVSDSEAVECTLTDSLVYKAKNYNLEISRHTDGICNGEQTVFLSREEAENALKGEGHE